jgi:transposase-like protein
VTDAERAARLSKVPGVTIAEACRRFGVTRAAIGKAREGLVLSITKTAGPVSELSGVASWLDHVDHAVYSPAEIRTMVADHVAFEGERWRVIKPWP